MGEGCWVSFFNPTKLLCRLVNPAIGGISFILFSDKDNIFKLVNPAIGVKFEI
jgi:hypothetical protein